MTTPVGKILLIEDDADTREAMVELLVDEGFVVDTASNVLQALPEVSKKSYSLIVADVWDRGVSRWEEIDRLVDLADPSPVAACTASRTRPTQAILERLAFYLEKPFAAERLLMLASEHCGNEENIERYRPQAEGYFAALTRKDWKALGALCTDDVAYFFPAVHPKFGRRVDGRDAFLKFSEETFQQFPDVAFEITSIAPLARGVVVGYRSTWNRASASPQSVEGAVVLRIEGDKISRIGIRMDVSQLTEP